MDHITLTFSIGELACWIIWLVIVLAGLSLVKDHRREREPRAAAIFAVSTVIFAIVGGTLIC